jgi:hypothetical protein
MPNHRLLTAIVLSLAVPATIPFFRLNAQDRGAVNRSGAIPRTPDGRPDLQGTYDVATITPVERPKELPDLILTKEQATRLERGEKARTDQRALPSPVDRDAPPIGGNVGGYNSFWIDRGTQVITVDGEPRSSLIVDPPNGLIPPLTADAERRAAARRGLASPEASEAGTASARAFENPEDRPLGERCLLGFGSTSGPPTLPNYFYNNLKQIVQTPTMVMILNEMVHDVRIIRIGGEHLPPHVRRWMGDSVGHWEGDTLVVDTTNFTDKTRFRGSSDQLHVLERFSRVDDRTLLYKFTVDDPNTWTRPWTGEYPWPATDEQIFEYACHEANYALENIMRGAREAERRASEKKP